MSDHDPPPLADPGSGAPPFLRDALRAARAETPSAAQLASLSARLPSGGPAAAGAAGTAPPSVLSGALIGAALGVIVSGAGFLWQARHEDRPRAPAAPEPVAAQVVPRVAAASPTEPARAGAETAPTAPQAPPAPAPAAASGAPQPSTVAAGAPAIPSSSVSSGEPAAVPPAGGAGSPGDLETEVRLLERARAALGASPAQALAITQEHAARFPGGALGQEREVLAIDALVRLGRAAEARARGARFMTAFPGSAHRRRIEVLLGP